jgi:hypothetical protein
LRDSAERAGRHARASGVNSPAIVVIAFVVLGIAGCVAPEAPKIAAPPPAPVPVAVVPKSLSTEADAALKAAEQSVVEARVRRTLWTAAVEQLDKARAAAKQLDSAATLAHATEVVTLCELALRQAKAPPVKW